MLSTCRFDFQTKHQNPNSTKQNNKIAWYLNRTSWKLMKKLNFCVVLIYSTIGWLTQNELSLSQLLTSRVFVSNSSMFNTGKWENFLSNTHSCSQVSRVPKWAKLLRTTQVLSLKILESSTNSFYNKQNNIPVTDKRGKKNHSNHKIGRFDNMHTAVVISSVNKAAQNWKRRWLIKICITD